MSEVFDLNLLEANKDRIGHCLGKQGCGAVALKSLLDEDFRKELMEEIEDPDKVIWRDAGETYTNDRGVLVEQNHDVFALKLSRGDQSQRVWVPKMDQLHVATQSLVRSVGDLYPSLVKWRADEMSYHRYYDAEKGLTFHRDNLRFTGVIAVVSVLGECDFQVIDRDELEVGVDPETGKKKVLSWDWRNTYNIPTTPGDVVLTRAPGLFDEMDNDKDRPEHAVLNVRVLPRISFMLRANNKPEDSSYGFTYHNWP